jgi:cytochrome c553
VTALPSTFGSALFLLGVLAAPRAGAQAESLVLSCPVCHGAPTTDAAHAPAAVPAFYGRPADEIAWQLREFRAGSRQGSAMSRLANTLTDAEIDALAHTYGAAN